MKYKRGIIIFALIEIIFGTITFIAVILSLIHGKSAKPLEVLIFVLTTSAISTALGVGILRYNLRCYHLLLFFSAIIVLSKILIFSKIITLSGALETNIPSALKNVISVFYHSLLIFYFTRKPVKERFGEHRDTLFSLRVPFLK